jgi:hypothetical protein
MPLDTGAIAQGLDAPLGGDRYDGGITPMQALGTAASVGAALRSVREHYRLTIDDIALATCIRKQYLRGLEEMRLDELPSRPFVIGYVRAYAGVLGLDGDRAVARFKLDSPDEDRSLRAPVGVAREGDRRLRPMVICGVLVVAAFLAWNVAQRAMSKNEPRPNAGAELAVSGDKLPTSLAKGPIAVGAPLPAPQDSTVPAPYVTPGMQPASADGSATSASAAKPLAPASSAPAGAPFVARGAVYGASPSQSIVTLQARKSVLLIIRGGGGTVYFARQLASGQAYRAPQTPGLSVESSDPAAVDVFVGGVLKGPLPAAQMVVARLAD